MLIAYLLGAAAILVYVAARLQSEDDRIYETTKRQIHTPTAETCGCGWTKNGYQRDIACVKATLREARRLQRLN